MSKKSEATWHPDASMSPAISQRAEYENVLLTKSLLDAQCERDEARAERDALARVIKQLTQLALIPQRWSEDRQVEVSRVLDSAPSAALARHDAEVKAQALDEAADAFGAGAWSEAFLTGDVQDDVSAVRATGTWFRARAAAIRTEAH